VFKDVTMNKHTQAQFGLLCQIAD